METIVIPRYIGTMASTSFKPAAVHERDTALTAAERKARAASIAHARAQAKAGETVSGESVFEWLASWGTENELPVPQPSQRKA